MVASVKYFSTFLILSLLVFSAKFCYGQKLNLVSWNLENFMSPAHFNAWNSYCKERGYADVNTKTKSPSLSYCDVNDGSSLGGVKNGHLAVRSSDSLQLKVMALRDQATQLNADIYALQEVTDIAALETIFDKNQFHLFASHHALPLNLGFAVRRSLNLKADFVILNNFAIKKGRYYRTRPAIELTLSNDKIAFKVLNMHLKAGCKYEYFDNPKLDRKSNLFSNCQLYRRQLALLKNWVMEQNRLKVPFILIGDLNRNLSKELNEFYTKNLPARLPGSDSFDLSQPITPQTKVAFLFPELSYSDENGGRLNVLFSDVKSKKYLKKDRCLFGNDYIIYNNRVLMLLKEQSTPVLTFQNYPDSDYSKDKPRPSDHCPINASFEFSALN